VRLAEYRTRWRHLSGRRVSGSSRGRIPTAACGRSHALHNSPCRVTIRRLVCLATARPFPFAIRPAPAIRILRWPFDRRSGARTEARVPRIRPAPRWTQARHVFVETHRVIALGITRLQQRLNVRISGTWFAGAPIFRRHASRFEQRLVGDDAVARLAQRHSAWSPPLPDPLLDFQERFDGSNDSADPITDNHGWNDHAHDAPAKGRSPPTGSWTGSQAQHRRYRTGLWQRHSRANIR
jgi:hypothetical protein